MDGENKERIVRTDVQTDTSGKNLLQRGGEEVVKYLNRTILSNTRVYLCGQIENDPKAAGWRKELARRLPLINSGIVVWDPMIKPQWALDTITHDSVAYKWKHHVLGGSDESKGHGCFDANAVIRRICKQLAGKCDWMIARISKTFTWGSIDELEIASQRRIPVFLWLPDGLISIYGLAGCVHKYECIQHYVHQDIESLLRTIAAIDNGQIDAPGLDPETWMRMTWKNASEIDNAES